MITEHELRERVAECQGVHNPNETAYILLAAATYLLDRPKIKDALSEILEAVNSSVKNSVNPNRDLTDGYSAYSYAAPPEITETLPRYSGAEPVGDYGDSDFLQAIRGQDPAAMWAVMDELMATLQTVNPRLYSGVMRRIQ